MSKRASWAITIFAGYAIAYVASWLIGFDDSSQIGQAIMAAAILFLAVRHIPHD